MDNSTTRWQAVAARDAKADGKFVYCVRTTKIYCRPNCKSRLARRSNVEFHSTAAEAEKAGYRACKRCQPQLANFTPDADRIEKVCEKLRKLPATAPLPSLESVAQEAGLTKHHFHRLFKRITGLTPRAFALACRGDERSIVPEREGLHSDSFLNMSESHSSSASTTPSSVATSGRTRQGVLTLGVQAIAPVTGSESEENHSSENPLDLCYSALDAEFDAYIWAYTVQYSVGETIYGSLLTAFHKGNICKLELGPTGSDLITDLERSFPSRQYTRSRIPDCVVGEVDAINRQIAAIVEALECPSGKIFASPSVVSRCGRIPNYELRMKPAWSSSNDSTYDD